jgi:hypothetical protein
LFAQFRLRLHRRLLLAWFHNQHLPRRRRTLKRQTSLL